MKPINMYDPTRDYNNYKQEYDSAIQSVLNKGLFIQGPEVLDLERNLSEYVGARFCISCANGTDALFISLLALDINPGDEIITVAHTWISTAEVIPLVKAKPIFVDINVKTFNIDIKQIERAITPKTKAIIPVSLYGRIANLEKIKHIADRYSIANGCNIAIIEDGAQSFGASKNGMKSCSCKYSTIATTSFFPSKPLGAYGDAGAIFTNDEALALKIRAIKSHGGLERFKHKYIGLNSRLDTLQAAILLVKLRKLDAVLNLRNDVAEYYNQKLGRNKNIRLPKFKPTHFQVWAQYSILLEDKKVRSYMIDGLKKAGINCAIFYPAPLHLQECFNYLEYKHGSLPVTELVADNIINLPCYAEITKVEQDYIIENFGHLLEKYYSSS